MVDAQFSLAGALTGFIVGFTGVGGGAFMTPILLLFFNVPPVAAVATDLWFAATTKLVAAAVHYRAGHVDWEIARLMAIGSIPAAVLMVILVAFGIRVQKVDWLTQVIGCLVLLTAVGLAVGPRLHALAERQSHQRPPLRPARLRNLTIIGGGAWGYVLP